MREDGDHLRHHTPLLHRVIILVAVLIAVPVILWTITGFVRSYFAPPQIPGFHELAGTEPSAASANTDSGAQPQSAVSRDKLSDPSTTTIEPRVPETDGHNVSVLKGSLPSEQSAANDVNTSTSPTKMSDASAAAPPSSKADTVAAPAAANPAPESVGALAAQPTAPASEPATETALAAAPLPGPIPLPRRRPHIAADAPMSQMAQMNMPLPLPRPRPDGAGAAAPPETNAGPLDFLQNIFH
jgi:hypothetical protein